MKRGGMEVGLRCVRGPDWKWSYQDDGEGHVGTVVEIGKPGSTTSPDKTVVVQWDSGSRTNYRVGYQGSYDLRIFDNAPIGVRHQNIVCDACKKQDVMGMRWTCLKCKDYDLCSQCYMADKHETNHSFLRIDYPGIPGVKVPKRNGSVKITAKGIFTGAKVVRGPDWDWGIQDDGKYGKVLDIRGWDTESGRSVACVAWQAGMTNVYRLGHKGKVDIKYISDGVGGTYYRDHLPVLGESVEPPASNSAHCEFKVGDKVRVDLDIVILKAMQEGHGGWNPKMADYIGRVGTVHRITERGDVRVQYEGCANRWTFHAGALTKVQQFAVGDIVKISDNLPQVKSQQKDHGEWTDQMKAALGQTGKVLKVYADGDLRVSVASQTWTFNPACCHLVLQVTQDVNKSGVQKREDASPISAIFQKIMELQNLTGPDILVREAAQGHLPMVKEIVTKHPDKIDQKSSGKTALQVASHQGHIELVKMLVNAGANLECQDEDGDTALHYSAFGNQPEVTELLLSKGSQINALNNGGCSTLHVAVNKQHVKCVKVLLKHKCDVNIQDSYGDTALHDAIGKDNKEIVEVLANHPGVDFSLKNKRGFNCLHHAALKGNSHATENILAKCPHLVDIKKEDGFGALHLASLNGHCDVADILLEKGGADIEIKNNRQQTPLLLSASQGHAAIVELLVSRGANIALEDEDGDTCLHLALMRQILPNEGEDSPAVAEMRNQLGLSEQEGPTSAIIAAFLAQKGASLSHKNKQGKAALDLVTDGKIVDLIQKFSSPSVEEEEEEEKVDCMVCCDDIATVKFEPCNHKIVCSDCCIKMKKCLVCQEIIVSKIDRENKFIDRQRPVDQENNATIQELQKQMQDMEDTINCSICLENKRNVAFLCGHSACSICAMPLKTCHMCRKPITKRINLF
ncbi:E3 ubiquitin-protein ligase MIB2-like isoform X2 [Lineus longissimus]|uniref:E3 ubiquitin-protein ligase MIB2-like isoform X2 n=1 Tax=Lineus longissimus TaxID=88925 RepID=UPI00315C9816